MAREHGLDLSSLQASGRRPLLARDVLEATERSTRPADKGSGAAPSRLWQVMASRTAQAWAEVPHFWLRKDADARRLLAWRNSFAGEGSVTLTDLFLFTVSRVLRTHPRMNSSWKESGLVVHDDVNVGLAVATDDGLVVPVVHRASLLSLVEIASLRKDLVGRAQESRLRPEDVKGGTFTISNLGMFGIDSFEPIVNAPEAAILAVGGIREVAAFEGVSVIRQPTVSLTVGCDHRAVDGARAAAFLGALAAAVEEPLRLFNARGEESCRRDR
jgi:pyruvate dehydrogenase E2 component (dihydrolipoamide acetyltransferase)